MFLLVLGGFLEEVRNLDIAVLAGLSGIIEILGVGLEFRLLFVYLYLIDAKLRIFLTETTFRSKKA